MYKLHRSTFRNAIIAGVTALLLIAGLVTFNTGNEAEARNSKVKNVIMMIPDGNSIEASTIARYYNNGEPMVLDEIAVGMTKTHWNQGPITDSAPGGTAYAIGSKTDDKHVGVLPGGVPAATLIEASRLKGKATGIVSTSEVMHATPADFTAHDVDRANYNSLMKQQIYNGLDVVLGGGNQFFTPEAGGKRADGKDLRETIVSLGYEYVTTREEMFNSRAKKIWGAFAEADMMYEVDRIATGSQEPTLAEMTKKAIDILSKDKDGFFLMVEGSKVDWAAHANDTVGMVGDILAYDDAVGVALEFAKKDGQTVVISSSDHGTGGPIIGGVNPNYSSVTFDESINKLLSAKISLDYANELLEGADEARVREIYAEYFGITDPTSEEIALALEGKINNVISDRANISWTYGGHIGGDVGLYSYAPRGFEQLGGVVDNTEVGRYMERVLGVNLDATSKRLFVNAKEAFERKGAEVTLDTSDMDNPLLIVKKGNNTLELFGYTNIVKLNGKEIKLEGLVVTNKIDGSYSIENSYVPEQAVKLLK
ncbi:alkaline phosphatase [Alloiococcus sp. CFN-8]|uniref:alkaline phosphatase n=1 Tax=Alloiococcus sp. CFN-8 TaxID=3416081 RepID=UPI003CEFF3AD